MALVLADTKPHAATAAAMGRRTLGLSGHAAFEAYSVLTRLPAPHRQRPSTIATLLTEAFPGTRHLSARAALRVTIRLAELGIAGGAVYDGLVGATAVEAGLPLATRDRRALATYRALEVDIEFIG